ncbi:ferritin-like domain-containing protein [Cytophagaceae bacterium DM2B3-1]|uniref:Ferritin-like domain-containing protein n=2 Tax=Xanthocytophaga TaxID=3078918 RepID=A0AAE3QPY9_9BACT|nr:MULTISPECIES: ferritin-like domain-containing protein [Xanthocytophaga]MDJ1469938.1 ferritin-like domain-containing protein [Xanthocytophaga flavus]MDJ1483337.1 ferritin-like domain-containing protein [Xanthocytophaga flavus]MDJ1494448.1 ferritin-like domain-containing protein [Xanthocytophaga flavus]MDJ1503142.1 ferritin-like domain-containing protein [Xanthocytophaga agilis]
MASFGDSVKNFFSGSDNVESLRELFLEELRDIYYAENKLVNTLPAMAEAATTNDLKTAITRHLEETRGHVRRLEQVFSSINETPSEVTCEAMKGLLEEGNELIDETIEGTLTRDAGIIIASQKVEHYEIAAYGSLRTLARLLGYETAASLLAQTLQEEKNADTLLTDIAESFVNQRALAE